MKSLVLDTDIGSDVDDALALAFALRHPEIDLRAVTTVSGDTARRGRIAATLLRLAGREDVEVAAGLAVPPPPGREVESGEEGEGLELHAAPLSGRDAVTLLLDATGAEVATVGMQTNLAAAVERDPAFAGRVPRLAVMGGVFARTPDFPPERDHNLNADPDGAVRALNAGLPTLYVPGDVTIRTRLPAPHVDRLRGAGDPLCGALASLIDIRERRYPTLLHDPLTVAAMVDTSLVTIERLPVTVALTGGIVRTFVDPVAGREADVVTGVDAPAFADLWLETVLG